MIAAILVFVAIATFPGNVRMIFDFTKGSWAVWYCKERERLKAVHMRLLLAGVKWPSKNRTETPIVEMSDGHLENCIAMIKRSMETDKRVWRIEMLPFLEDERAYRKMMGITTPRDPERGT